MTERNKLVITGGCGFIGHHFVEHFLKTSNWDIIILDKLTYASTGFDRLRDIDVFEKYSDRVRVFPISLNHPLPSGIKKEIGDVDYIINLASESHVDNSIKHPVLFIQNNIDLVLHLMEWCREIPSLKRFIQFSTDEVYGTAPYDENDYCEGDRFNPGNPYAASKAAQEMIVISYANTYSIPAIITNTMNVIGERQDKEKFVPLVIGKVLNNETVKIHSDSTRTVSGSRFYIHARNVANAISFLLSGYVPESELKLSNTDASAGKFNIVGEAEISNFELAQMISKDIGKDLKFEMVDFHSSRPGHDLRYALDGSKMRRLGWVPQVSIEESLKKVVDWELKRIKK